MNASVLLARNPRRRPGESWLRWRARCWPPAVRALWSLVVPAAQWISPVPLPGSRLAHEVAIMREQVWQAH